MTTKSTSSRIFVFPPWTNKLPKIIGINLLGGLLTLILVVYYYFSPLNTHVGYEPTQPIPYSHKLHAGQLGIDCKYCHRGVDTTDQATIPSVQLCLNCHGPGKIKDDSPKLALLRHAATHPDEPPPQWVKVHKVADYAYFPHAIHVNGQGGKFAIGCVTCHGRIDSMEEVRQVEPLSMAWCLDCHRSPESKIRPADQATNMIWQWPNITPGHSAKSIGSEWLKQNNITLNPPTDCSRCHR